MNTGAHRHHVTLDNGAGTPLSPPDWYCAHLSETTGQATLIGRYHPGIATDTRVHLKGKTYHVDAVVNREERDTELVLSVTEVFDA